jgi:ribosomal protein L13E
MDWDEFLAGLSDRDKAIINCLVEGKPLAHVARRRRLSASTVRSRKQHLAKAVAEFMGLDILVDIQRRPRWKDNLNATRERLSCREERRHL